jgi:hypothetical protein
MKNMTNIYQCPYGHQTITVDLVEGTTPMMLRCKQKADDGIHNCTQMAMSLWYKVDQTLKPEYEWYKPDSLKGLNSEEREHVKLGGLLLRKSLPTN